MARNVKWKSVSKDAMIIGFADGLGAITAVNHTKNLNLYASKSILAKKSDKEELNLTETISEYNSLLSRLLKVKKKHL